MKGLLDYSLLIAVEESEQPFDQKKILAERKLSAKLMGKKTLHDAK